MHFTQYSSHCCVASSTERGPSGGDSSSDKLASHAYQIFPEQRPDLAAVSKLEAARGAPAATAYPCSFHHSRRRSGDDQAGTGAAQSSYSAARPVTEHAAIHSACMAAVPMYSPARSSQSIMSTHRAARRARASNLGAHGSASATVAPPHMCLQRASHAPVIAVPDPRCTHMSADDECPVVFQTLPISGSMLC